MPMFDYLQHATLVDIIMPDHHSLRGRTLYYRIMQPAHDERPDIGGDDSDSVPVRRNPPQKVDVEGADASYLSMPVTLSEVLYLSMPMTKCVFRHLLAQMLPEWRILLAQHVEDVTDKFINVSGRYARYKALPLQMAQEFMALHGPAAINAIRQENAEIQAALAQIDQIVANPNLIPLGDEAVDAELTGGVLCGSSHGPDPVTRML